MSEQNLSQKKLQKPTGSSREAARLINGYLANLQLAVGIEMKPERIGIYVQELSDLSERQIYFMFARAMKESKWIPALPELLAWAREGAEEFQYQEAAARTKTLTSRGNKPEDWLPQLDSVWAEIERRADAQELEDLAYQEPFTDVKIEALLSAGKGFPGTGRWVDYARRKEARERRAQGIPRPRSRARYGPLMETVMAAVREPGQEG